jgi:hypothetical protein
MLAWRNLGILLAILIVASPAWCGPEQDLSEPVKADDCFRISLEMNLTGEMRINRDGTVVPIKLEARAKHAFQERVLLMNGALPCKVARVYDIAQATIATGSDHSERSLRPERKLIVAQRQKDLLTTYCPAGSLLREELELTNDHLDTLSLTGLLPTSKIKPGETWKVSNEVVQALCGFEGLVSQDLEGKLDEIKDDVARISIKGKAAGIDSGASVKLTIDAACEVSLSSHRFVRMEWSQSDEREQGPVSPASTLKTTTIVKREPIEAPECLGQVALVGVPAGLEVPATLTPLWFHDAQGRFELNYGREWALVAQTKDHLVLRLMERGDFIAQCTITPWRTAEKGQHMSPTRFRELIDNTPGWELEKELQAGEVNAGNSGGWVYRVSALGHMDGVPALQNYFVVAGPNGDQAIVLFTMNPKQADKLGSRDLSLVGAIEFPPKKD